MSDVARSSSAPVLESDDTNHDITQKHVGREHVGREHVGREHRQSTAWDLDRVVGLAAILSSVVYLASDVIEVAQGRFSTIRLSMTYPGEAALPLVILGLYASQRPRIGRLGLIGAAAYAYSYVFFTSTVVYALAARTRDYAGVTTVFGAWMTLHGVIMVLGGTAFGVATVRARVLPRWTGVCLVVGVVLVAAASGLSPLARTIAEAFPATALAGMGYALVRGLGPRGGGPRGASAPR